MTSTVISTAITAMALSLAWANDACAQARPAANNDDPPCIEVQVNGERIPAWECLQRKLAPAAPAAQRPALPAAEQLMRTPGNTLLQYNLEGTRQRMGDAFGRSVVPQRPAR